MIKRALISVFDKTGIADFVMQLHKQFGVEIISTGGTAKVISDAGIPVTLVEDITGFGSLLDGRVKTLHPKIYAAILADRDNPDHMKELEEMDIKPIDLVVVDMYPFQQAVEDGKPLDDVIEMIDIGGPAMLRAAAKNYKHVLVATADRMDLHDVIFTLAQGRFGAKYYRKFAERVFVRTQTYETDIRDCLLRRELKYGENPHQTAYAVPDRTHCDNLISSMPDNMSYNNILDVSAGLDLCHDLGHQYSHQSVIFIKHNNACGVGLEDNLTKPDIGFERAYEKAYLGDPNAAFGGVLVCSHEISKEQAKFVMETRNRHKKAKGFFVEVWMAPAFYPEAIELIRSSGSWGERVKIVRARGTYYPYPGISRRTVVGGTLVQTKDTDSHELWKSTLDLDTRMAWIICKHSRSNAISICKDGQLIGNGVGQMSRVVACELAVMMTLENGHEAEGASAASDAFFPFSDGPEALIDAGIKSIIQPGGSKRDEDTVDLCKQHGVALTMTGIRHFKH